MGVAKMRLGQNDEAMQAFQMAIDLSGGRYARAELALATSFAKKENQARRRESSAGD